MFRADDNNSLRVLVATDCHLGYMEKDEIRRFDSFQAFEEICSIAEKNQVDFLLLGGDLFHENKPSRSTLVKTIEILRRYCLNDRPVQFQVVSDQTVNFQNVFGHVNYEDPHFNVGLPVFTIHGNHDDPAGVDNLSAIDILSASNLVNYFGKMVLGGSGVGEITIYPILIRKGITSIALYGLGNIRDERLNRMFQTPHAVQWIRPEAQEGFPISDWFNILVLHQNRVKANPKNAINEHFLPRFLDFVVWGHEHECLVDPQEVSGMGFHITQPGSSVATSLIDGEAKPKHVLLLEIKGSQYRPTKIPLKSVRPFEYAEVVLKDEDGIDPNDQASVLEHLDQVVRNLIDRSRKSAISRLELKLPLVRIKVDYSGFSTINPQRFGQKYVGKVANPQDILIFSKTAKKRQFTEEKIDESERLRPEELNQQNIEALVAESNLKMEILAVNDLDIALHDFVNKDDKLAFYSCLRNNLEETRNKLIAEADTSKIDDDDLIVKVGMCMQERVKERSLRQKDNMTITTGSHNFQDPRRKNATIPTSANSFSDEEETRQMLSISKPSQGRGGATRRGRGKGSGNLKQMSLDETLKTRQSKRSASVSMSVAIRNIVDEGIDSPTSEETERHEINEIVESSEPEETNTAKGRKRAAPRGRGRDSASSSKRGRKPDFSSIHNMFMNKDDDDDDEDDISNRFKRVQPRATKNYGAIRKRS
ncbi:double-strand break repair protein MRE11 isoform X1 [Curcuma longa]|uniref:double-strand break repair protein MRE11 isoform X1 n=1 Tax=Curcuma longa TaxID=136217 RepID=UPI003D9EF71A